jgi:hypothetical protein
MIDFAYIIVVTAVLNAGGLSFDQVEMNTSPYWVESQKRVHQTVFVGASMGEARALFRKTKPILEKMVPGSRAVPTCYEAALKMGTVREIPCP